MRFGKRPAEYGKVLTINIDQSTVDGAAAGDHPVAGDFLFGHAKVGAIMRDIGVEFFEAAFIQQDIKAFARSQATLGMLRVNALLSATQFGRCAPQFQFSDVGRHGFPHKQFCCVKLWHRGDAIAN